MWTELLIILILLLTQRDVSCLQDSCNSVNIANKNHCKTKVDKLTKKVVYTTADTSPKNEGGKNLLLQRLSKIIVDDIPLDYDPNFIIEFIVDKDGNIEGERVVNDKTHKIGQQMIDIVKSFKWTPAICNNKKVPMLYRLPLIIDIAVE